MAVWWKLLVVALFIIPFLALPAEAAAVNKIRKSVDRDLDSVTVHIKAKAKTTHKYKIQGKLVLDQGGSDWDSDTDRGKALSFHLRFDVPRESTGGRLSIEIFDKKHRSMSKTFKLEYPATGEAAEVPPTEEMDLAFTFAEEEGGTIGATLAATSLGELAIESIIVVRADGGRFNGVPEACELIIILVCASSLPAKNALQDIPLKVIPAGDSALKLLARATSSTGKGWAVDELLAIAGDDGGVEPGYDGSTFLTRLTGPASGLVGDRLSYQYDVVALAPPQSHVVDLEINGPAKFQDLPTGCVLDGLRARCTLAPFAGAEEIIPMIVGTGDGDVILRATSEGAAPTQATTRMSMPRTDLEFVSLDASSTGLKAGEETDIQFSVKNAGALLAREVVVTTEIPEGVDLGVSEKGPCVLIGRTVTCFLGTILPGETSSAKVAFGAKKPGTYTSTAAARSLAIDTDPSNDARTLTVVVGPA